MRACLTLLLALSLAVPLPARAGEITRYKADVDFIREAMESSLERSLPPLGRLGIREISVRSVAEGKNNWLVEEGLKRVLLGRGCRVIEGEAGPDSLGKVPGYIISYRLADISLNCFRRGHIPLRRRVERRLRAYCFLQLSRAGGGPVIWADWVKVSAVDSIPEEYSRALENKELIERHFVENKGKKMEVLASLAVTGSLIYLLRESK